MRNYPTDKYDHEEAQHLGAKPWMLELLKLNPAYTAWGNNEDYMSDGSGWEGPCEIETFSEMWSLDSLNELVHFYFKINRSAETCEHCEGQGLNKATKLLSNTWYQHLCPPGYSSWSNKLTQVEVDALWEGNRLWRYKEKPTPEMVNRDYAKGMGHDAINHWICVKARAEQQGVYGHCEHCEGKGHIYIEPEPRVSLQLWMLHPRKGAARGLLVKHITQDDLPAVFALLKEADNRNRERFARISDESLAQVLNTAGSYESKTN